MDHSLKSSRGKVPPTTTTTTTDNNPNSQEESGWTTYFDDFSNGIEPSYYSGGGSSLVSDAASSAAWKFSHHHNHLVSSKLPKKLCFKKTRSKIISDDDPLEDTASSPVNSPKVRDMSPNEIASRKIDDQLQAGSMGKGLTSSENHSELLQMDDKLEFEFNEKNIDCIELKKRGLCLVPLSLLVNYLG
ncbi:unnamed protein product [Lathyrus oleraceus]|uniref:Uncharacterized protein n=2 Tax=Pisum sativum TaxID=3888 RepID=A0A9D4VW95_PEA|nr:vascular-related unknown protein 1-like [Pisum sativum]KAI5390019.1 hypothetical protein KIW84_075371 [Pisum sativum]